MAKPDGTIIWRTLITVVLLIVGWILVQLVGLPYTFATKDDLKEVKSALAISDRRFTKIYDVLGEHTVTLGRMDERMKFIANQSGYKGD